MTDPLTAVPPLDEAARVLRAHAEPLPAPERAEEFGALFDRFGDCRVVLLGEASHGTAEFYRARAAITRRLVERHGFTIVALEADWPAAAAMDRYARDGEEGWMSAFRRFPTWMWANAEMRDLLDWLHIHNGGRPRTQMVEIRGLDIYSLGESIAAVLDYLDKVDPAGAKTARERYACLTPWQAEPARYGAAVLRGQKDDCEDEAVAQLRDMLERRLSYVSLDGETFLDAVQNARVVAAAEQYYRIMYRGAAESWNLRDRHMFETLRLLLNARPQAKAVVWAHNSHVGNAAATSMGWNGEFNIGELCRHAFGDQAALIGFSTDRGTVAAASDWDEPMEVKAVRPSREDSHERVFRHTGIARFLADWRDPARRDLRVALAHPRLERAIGVVYRPETELASHYFQAILPEQFDAWVWFEETRAVTPLAAPLQAGADETWPTGL